MLRKIKRKDALSLYPHFPQLYYNKSKQEYQAKCPEVYERAVLQLPSAVLDADFDALFKETYLLFRALKFDSLMFLRDMKLSWVDNTLVQHPPEHLKDALNYFKKNGVQANFSGGLEVSSAEFFPFTKYLYEITRAISTLSAVSFMDSNHKYLGHIHYSGDWIIECLTQDAYDDLQLAVAETRFLFSEKKTSTHKN